MKKIILIGKRDSGKTTLIQKIMERELIYQKTQSLDFYPKIIDTPGEYLENKHYYKALLITSMECDAVLLLQDICDNTCLYPPGFAAMFNRCTIGILTKNDLNINSHVTAEKCLKNAGVEKIFKVSSYNGDGLIDLKKYLEYL